MTDMKQQLSALFNAQEGPTIMAAEGADDSAILRLHVDAHLSWFDGHFPDHKVLPGVVQIDWAGKLGKALFSQAQVFKQLTNIKFKSMVMPDTTLDLELRFNADKGTLKFHFFNESESFSMGSFKFIPS